MPLRAANHHLPRRAPLLADVAVPRGAARDGALGLVTMWALRGLPEPGRLLAHRPYHLFKLGNITRVGFLLCSKRGPEGVLDLHVLLALLVERKLQALQFADRLLLPPRLRREMRGRLACRVLRRGADSDNCRARQRGRSEQVLPHFGNRSVLERISPLQDGCHAIRHDPLQTKLVQHLQGSRGDVIAFSLGVFGEHGDHPAIHPIVLVVREHHDRVPDCPAQGCRGRPRRLRCCWLGRREWRLVRGGMTACRACDNHWGVLNLWFLCDASRPCRFVDNTGARNRLLRKVVTKGPRAEQVTPRWRGSDATAAA
mmetsp:Transcript_15552/g.41187  ORF Transcript_15552/g.41187 Transcript_15552/m.41187 type:complete len:313 (-) Transcript_15552:612-1550(-)